MNPIARRNARRYVVQAMYQWQLSDNPISQIESEFLTQHIKNDIDLDYFKELLHSIPEKVAALDERIRPFLSRALEELDPVELAILRISFYELLHRPDVPYRVVINEALELAKRFGSIEGYKFVNGVLDQAARDFRKLEIKK